MPGGKRPSGESKPNTVKEKHPIIEICSEVPHCLILLCGGVSVNAETEGIEGNESGDEGWPW